MIGSSMPLDLSTLEKLYRLCRIVAKKHTQKKRTLYFAGFFFTQKSARFPSAFLFYFTRPRS